MFTPSNRDRKPLFVFGGIALVLAMSAAMLPRRAFSQDESIKVSPATADEDEEPAVDPAADSTATGAVLDLPQVVSVNPEDAAAAPDDPTDPEAATDSSTAQAEVQPADDQPGDATQYADQGQLGDDSAAAEPVPLPGAASGRVLARPPSVITTYPVGGGWRAPGWIRVPTPAVGSPILPTSPMLTTPRGAAVTMGGWWNRAR